MNQPTKQVLQTFVFISSVMLFWVTKGSGSVSAYDGGDYRQDSHYSQQTRDENDDQDSGDRSRYWQHDDEENSENNSERNSWKENNNRSYQQGDQASSDMNSSSADDNTSKRNWHNKNGDDDTSSTPNTHYTQQKSMDVVKRANSDSNSSSNWNANLEHNDPSDRNQDSSDRSRRYDDQQQPTHYMAAHFANDDRDVQASQYDAQDPDDSSCDEQSSSESNYGNRHDDSSYHGGYTQGYHGDGNYHHRNNGHYAHYTNWRGGHNHDMDETNNELALTLRSNLQEHAALALPAMRAEIEQTADRDAVMAAVDMNTEAIADTVDMMFADTKDEFTTLWKTHLDAYVMAADAARDNDAAGMQTAKEKLAVFASDAAGWFAKQNPDYDADTLEDMFATHGEQTLGLIDKIAKKDYMGVYASAHDAYVHMGMLADYLAGINSSDDQPMVNEHVDDAQQMHGDMLVM